MAIALAVRDRADCKGRKVGAVLVMDDRVVSTGYNGTPAGMSNCSDGGCWRCLNRGLYKSGTAYDLCICVHAEQNALLGAARFGIRTDGSQLYTTLQPCFGCLKESIQAHVTKITYIDPWASPDGDPDLEKQYRRMNEHIPGGVHQLLMSDPRQVWASSNGIVTSVSVEAHGIGRA
jgi:dCMP deaminase